MKTYARIQDGRVAELLTTAANPGSLYHPSLLWVDVSGMSSVAVGWNYDGSRFSARQPQPQPQQATATKPTIEDLQSHLSLISAQIAALRKPI